MTAGPFGGRETPAQLDELMPALGLTDYGRRVGRPMARP
jgi:hypothetical protein